MNLRGGEPFFNVHFRGGEQFFWGPRGGAEDFLRLKWKARSLFFRFQLLGPLILHECVDLEASPGLPTSVQPPEVQI